MKAKSLLETIKGASSVYIQSHDFPDHDAIASAYGLQQLLKVNNISARIVYSGEIQRRSLKEMMDVLDIKALAADRQILQPEDKIIIVDGCKGNKNVTDLIGEEVGVIDHHETATPEDVAFVDIRSELGACSTLIHSYYKELHVQIPRSVSTALMIGMLVDTYLMTRGVSKRDVNAYSDLYGSADIRFVNSVLRNKIQTKDLAFYREALASVVIKKGFAFHYFQDGCNQNLLGIIGDFFITLKEVDFVFLCAKNNGHINFSLRSEVDYWNASKIIKALLRDLGYGGGHKSMAGGIIQHSEYFNHQVMFKKLESYLQKQAVKSSCC